ncbi:MAG: radical SAM protein [Deltaproteobacteria bacterium]|jgi:uncharacterized radical SAM superfamily Fe-S cluster-containing enzyme|nr:radical SAM protein [Deltaproteobacteria bacterium]
MRLFSITTGWCRQCQKTVPARTIEDGGRIWLERFCPDHGPLRTLIEHDPERYSQSLAYVKPSLNPAGRWAPSFSGCPQSCGLCPEHRQHTCLPVAEITDQCDLKCPICLKPKKASFGLTPEEFRRTLAKLADYEGSLTLLNLSGGEPTLHPRFGEFIEIARQMGVAQTTVSTNGLKLLADPNLRALLARTRTVAALQFDTFDDQVCQKLRGRRLVSEKMRLIELLEREDVPYSLTAVAVKDVNDGELAALADFFFSSKALSLMIQPVAVTGAAGDSFGPENRLTMGETIDALESTSFINQGDLVPLACSHPRCAASAYYFKASETRFVSLKDFLGQQEYLDVTVNRSFPGIDSQGHQAIKNKLYDIWANLDRNSDDSALLDRVRTFLRRIEGRTLTEAEAFELGREAVKSVFIHSLMDEYCFDLDRLIKCCNHYLRADGRLVPMCAQNVTGAQLAL